MTKLQKKMAALDGMSDALAGGLMRSFKMMINLTDGIFDKHKATCALEDVLQEEDWHHYHRAVIKALEEIDKEEE